MKNLLYSTLIVMGLLLLLFLYRVFDSTGIVFYQAMSIIKFSTVVFFIVFVIFYLKGINISHFVIYFISCILFFYSFVMTLPVVVDRSITLHMLAYLDNKPIASTEEIRSDFINKFVINSAAIEKRIQEQEAIGNITTNEGNVQITPKGMAMHKFFDKLARFFNFKPTYDY